MAATTPSRELATELGRLLKKARPVKADDLRMQRLEEFSRAVIDSLLAMVDEGAMTPDEMVFTMLAAGYFVHIRRVMKQDAPPDAKEPIETGKNVTIK